MCILNYQNFSYVFWKKKIKGILFSFFVIADCKSVNRIMQNVYRPTSTEVLLALLSAYANLPFLHSSERIAFSKNHQIVFNH